MAVRFVPGLLPLSNIHVILNQPQRAANVGSVARVLQNFGLSSLRIVSTRAKPHHETFEAMKLATPHAMPILQGIKIYKTLPEVPPSVLFPFPPRPRPGLHWSSPGSR